MRKKHILTSLFTIWLLVPVVSHATAIYSENPGFYVMANGTQHVACPAGYVCPGLDNEPFNNEDLGIYPCNEIAPGGNFTQSEAGSYAPEQCYYVNTNEEQCENINIYMCPGPSDPNYDPGCVGNISPTYVSGYVDIRHYYSFNPYQSSDEEVLTLDTLGACAVSGVLCSGQNEIPRDNGPLADYIFQSLYTGTPYGRPFVYDGGGGPGSGGPYVDVSFHNLNNTIAAGYGAPGSRNPGEWEIQWPDGTLMKGTSNCDDNGGMLAPNGESTQIGTIADSGSLADGEAGGNNAYFCWCKLLAYKYHGVGNFQYVTNDWVYAFFDDSIDPDTGDRDMCPRDCTLKCADMAAGWYNMDPNGSVSNFELKRILYGDAGYITNECIQQSVPTVNVTWYHLNNTVHDQNTCTYGGAVTFPNTPTRKGYRFNGWNILNN